MRACSIVIGTEFFQSQVQVPFVNRNEIVQTLPANRADEPLAVGIGDRRLLHLKVTLRRDVSG